jgi:hypothetical protein
MNARAGSTLSQRSGTTASGQAIRHGKSFEESPMDVRLKVNPSNAQV